MMRTRLRTVLLALLYLICFGGLALIGALVLIRQSDAIAAAEYLLQHSPPFPDFVSPVGQEQGITAPFSSMAECFNLHEERIWELGELGGPLHVQIQSSLQISIDGMPIPRSGWTAYDPLVGGWIFDNKNQVIGSYGYLTVCVGTDHLWPGAHLVSIRLSNTLGRDYHHSWAISRSIQPPSTVSQFIHSVEWFWSYLVHGRLIPISLDVWRKADHFPIIPTDQFKAMRTIVLLPD